MEQDTQNYEIDALHFLNNNILLETEKHWIEIKIAHQSKEANNQKQEWYLMVYSVTVTMEAANNQNIQKQMKSKKEQAKNTPN